MLLTKLLLSIGFTVNMTTKQNGPLPVHYHNSIKSTSNSAVYQPVSSIITTPLTDKYTVGENVGRYVLIGYDICVHMYVLVSTTCFLYQF